METIFKGKYEFKGYNNASDSICYLEITLVNGDEIIVLASELDENRSTSMTNRCEHIATELVARYNFNPAKLVWVCYYPANGFMRKVDEYRLAILRWRKNKFIAPIWQNLTLEDVEKIRGVSNEQT